MTRHRAGSAADAAADGDAVDAVADADAAAALSGCPKDDKTQVCVCC